MLRTHVVRLIFFAMFIVVRGEPGNPYTQDYECRCNDPNAIFRLNPNPCPRTCAYPGGQPCNNPRLEQGCECRLGYYLNDSGQCVQLHDCPGAKKCSVNETFVFCNSDCPIKDCPEDDYRGIIVCSEPYPCKSGCACREDYLRSSDGRCLLYSDCPPIKCRRQNEVYFARAPQCLFEACTDIGKDNECHTNYPNRPKCVCKKDYYRDHNDVCVCKEDCFKPPPKCGVNEHHLDCLPCPPLLCDTLYTDYECLNSTGCESGCECLPGFLRNDNDICVPKDKCPPAPVIPICGEFEELSSCVTVCPPQNCSSLYILYNCAENLPCEWGCECIAGYLRNDEGKCIPSEQCSNPIPCGLNEAYTGCVIECPPLTCDSIFTSYMCSNETQCKGGCDCIDGHLRNANGFCVPSEECFSEPECDISPECRSTCAYPEPECSLESKTSLDNVDGCKCKAGYILLATDGPCVKIDECPDRGCNGDSNSVVTACPWPCPSTCNSPEAGTFGHKCDDVGCQCKHGFILEEETGMCVEPEKCKCGNPCGENGTFADCAFPCPNQYCPQYVDQPEVACKPGRLCAPGCLCKPGYLKLSYDDETCVLKEDCPKSCNVSQECRPTCAVPNPPGCPYIPPAETNVDSCNCQAGYVLSAPGGKCIKVEECQTKTCNNDPHARIKECPPPCPSTCSMPNAFPCKMMCEPIGCECESGYLRGKNGSCVLPEECSGGNPCGINGTFTDCAFSCPNQYCRQYEDQPEVACKPGQPCLSGCLCKPGYLKLSYDNRTCVLKEDCPKPCNISQECRPTCAVPNPPGCPYIPPAETNVDSCNCQAGYVLSAPGGKCIKVEECQSKSCNNDPHARIKECPQACPSTCSIPNAYLVCKRKCDPIGCECESGYLRGENGSCILPEECPDGNPCGKNEIFSSCLSHCPNNFCPTENTRGSVCETSPFAPCNSGCTCRLNHKRLSVQNRTCIVSSDCPPLPCPENEEWVSCPSECQSESCDAVDEPKTVCNALVLNCEPSCRCKKNYFRRDDGTCVCAEECRKINRQNEKENKRKGKKGKGRGKSKGRN